MKIRVEPKMLRKLEQASIEDGVSVEDTLQEILNSYFTEESEDLYPELQSESWKKEAAEEEKYGSLSMARKCYLMSIKKEIEFLLANDCLDEKEVTSSVTHICHSLKKVADFKNLPYINS